jgi:tripartite-type tricarboxylate transporter receptor subunit TctC
VELFLLQTGTRMLHVPYKGPAPGVIDLVAGRVVLMAASTVATLPHVRSGRLRPIGISTPQRMSSLPDIPTIGESGVPGFEAVSWFGLAAHAATPKDIIARLNKESVAILKAPAAEEHFLREGAIVVANSAAEFDAYIRSEAVKWAKVVKAAGIKPE